MSEITREILDVVQQTPLVSSSAMHLISVLHSQSHASKDIVAIIECDTVLTATMLKIVNSAAYGLRRSIDTISQAVFLLGESEIFRIAMVHMCATPIYRRALPFYERGKGKLWIHALRAGIASKNIAKFAIHSVNEDVAFTGGILADIGKTIIGQFLQRHEEQFLSVIRESKTMQQNFILAERELLGTDHCQIGAALSRKWQLPEPLQECIRCHHYPNMSSPMYRTISYIVHLGDIVAMMGEGSSGIDCLAYPIEQDYPTYVNISSKDLARIMLDVDRYMKKLASSAGLKR